MGAWRKRYVWGATGWGSPRGRGSSDRTLRAGVEVWTLDSHDREERSRAPRPGLRGGEAPLWGGMRDAAYRGTQAETRDRKRKFACLSLSFSISPRGKSKELPHSGAGDAAPQNSPSFPAVPLFPEGGTGGERREGSRFVPGAALPAGMGWGAACGRPGRGPRLSAPAASPFRLRLSRPPSIWQGFPLARLLCARRARCTQGALWSPDRGCSEPRFPAPLLRSGRPGSGLVEYFVNCVSGIRSGVPPWLAVGFSPCSNQPLPSVTCRRFFPRGAGSPHFVRQQQGGEYL